MSHVVLLNTEAFAPPLCRMRCWLRPGESLDLGNGTAMELPEGQPTCLDLDDYLAPVVDLAVVAAGNPWRWSVEAGAALNLSSRMGLVVVPRAAEFTSGGDVERVFVEIVFVASAQSCEEQSALS